MSRFKPVITVSVITYNHSRCVRQALDSILMQQIDVPYEICIMDDASQDGTQDILREYRRKYPDKIRLYLRRYNNGAWPTRNGYFLSERVRGKYIACLEGDDYWTDPHKLQRQYDYLEAHPEMSGCVTAFHSVDENNNPVYCFKGNFQPNGIFTLQNFINMEYAGQTLTLMYRNVFDRETWKITYQADHIMGDIPAYMLILMHGNIAQLPDDTAAYRYMHTAGGENWNSKIVTDMYHGFNMLQFHVRIDRFLQHHCGRSYTGARIDERYLALPASTPVKALWNLSKEVYPRRRGYKLFFKHYLFVLVQRILTGREILFRGKNTVNTGLPNNLWEYPMILFGAGKMTEVFLEREGWRENIRFIVDNNQKLWGTTKYGKYIKDPLELKGWKNKAHILIMNASHEREIYQQVHDLGVKHVYCWLGSMKHILRNKIALFLIDKVKII